MDFAIPPGILGIKIFDGISLVVLPFFLKKQNRPILKIGPRIKLIILIVFMGFLIGSILSLNPWISLFRLWQQLNLLLFFFVLLHYSRDTGYLIKIKKYLITGILIIIAFTFFQLLFGLEFTLYSSLNPNVYNHGTRYPGPFHDPQKFAQYLAMVAFLLFAFSDVFEKQRRLLLFLGFISAALIMITGSRGALFGFSIGIIYFSLIHAIHSKKLVNIVIISIVAVSTYVLSENALIFKRVESSSNDLAYRYSIWVNAYDLFLSNPVSGIGTGNYQTYSEINNPDHFWLVNEEKVYFDHPESGFLLWLVEYGVLGFGFLVFTILFIINPFKNLRTKIRNRKINTLLEAGIISWIVGFITVNSLGDKRIGIMLVVLFSFLFLLKYQGKSRLLKIDFNQR